MNGETTVGYHVCRWVQMTSGFIVILAFTVRQRNKVHLSNINKLNMKELITKNPDGTFSYDFHKFFTYDDVIMAE